MFSSASLRACHVHCHCLMDKHLLFLPCLLYGHVIFAISVCWCGLCLGRLAKDPFRFLPLVVVDLVCFFNFSVYQDKEHHSTKDNEFPEYFHCEKKTSPEILRGTTLDKVPQNFRTKKQMRGYKVYFTSLLQVNELP